MHSSRKQFSTTQTTAKQDSYPCTSTTVALCLVVHIVAYTWTQIEKTRVGITTANQRFQIGQLSVNLARKKKRTCAKYSGYFWSIGFRNMQTVSWGYCFSHRYNFFEVTKKIK